MIILFVGSNPSNTSATNNAFDKDTRSGQILGGWTRDLAPQVSLCHINVSSGKTPNNRPLKVSEIKENLPTLQIYINMIEPDRVVALGKTAAKALTLLGITFYEMPHPSGLNRLLNDPAYVQEKVKGLLEFCSEQPLDSNSPKL